MTVEIITSELSPWSKELNNLVNKGNNQLKAAKYSHELLKCTCISNVQYADNIINRVDGDVEIF